MLLVFSSSSLESPWRYPLRLWFRKKRSKSFKRVWVCGELAQGLQSEIIECVLVGEYLDEVYIKELCSRVQELTDKTVNAEVSTEILPEQLGQCLLVWAQETAEK